MLFRSKRNNKGFKFTSNKIVSETGPWKTIHASLCPDSMPEPNVYGTWVPLTGTTPADWYYVAHHVTELIFVTDFAGGVGEISGIDNPRIIPKDLGVNCFGVAPCTPTDSNGVIFVNVTDTAGCPFFTYYWSTGAVTTTGQIGRAHF